MIKNPLLGLERPVKFSAIKPKHIRPAVDEAIKIVNNRIRKIIDHEYVDFLTEFDQISKELDEIVVITNHIESVCASDAFREANLEVQSDISAFYNGFTLNLELWDSILNYSKSEESKILPNYKQRYLNQILDEFRNNGINLPPDIQKELIKINNELDKLTDQFSYNVTSYISEFKFLIDDFNSFSGVPNTYVEELKNRIGADGKIQFEVTLKQTTIGGILKFADNEELRKRIYFEWSNRAGSGPNDNSQLIIEILKLRQSQSKILGYSNFADMVASDRMVKFGSVARNFLIDLKQKIHTGLIQEFKEIQEFRDQLEGINSKPIQIWDLDYYLGKMKIAQIHYDSEQIREYFPFNRVLYGLFGLAHDLFGVTINEINNVDVWDPSVQAFEMFEQNEESVGIFYIDPYSRSNKSEGAWMLGMIDGNSVSQPSGCIAMNATEPTSEKTSLLSNYDIRTLFHEFGHLVHHMFSKARLSSHFGTNVTWDFVEFPSQWMENWTMDRNTIRSISSHYQTGEIIPESLIDSIQSQSDFKPLISMADMLCMAEIDLALHQEFDPSGDVSPIDFVSQLIDNYYPIPIPNVNWALTGFNHIFETPCGYAATYYSYKWAEVLDADAFEIFKKYPDLKRELGQRLRNEILEIGDEEDPGVIFKNYMKRVPNDSAFLKRYGLI